jgi:hypothetical protein
MGNVKIVSGGPRANRASTAIELARTSNKSECTRESEMPGAYLAVFHTAGAGGKTDSTMRRCVPQPSAIVPARYHVSHCAWTFEARYVGHAKHSECTRRRRLGLLASYQGDSVADHAAPGTECIRCVRGIEGTDEGLGISAFVEHNGKRILFDRGMMPQFLNIT